MKKISLLLMSILVAFGISAQETQNVSYGDVHLKNKGSDNWFMTLAGGANTFFGNGFGDADFIDATSWQGQLSVGKWLSPIIGGRIAVNVAQHEHYNAGSYIPSNTINPHVDLMWNATNALVGYKADRVYNFIPYAGLGGLIGMEEDFGGDTDLELTWNMGLINNFQLSKNFSIFIDLAATMLKGNFAGRFAEPVADDDYSYDVIGQALVGIKFGLGGKQDFTTAELMDYNLINDLNSQINRLRAENEHLSKRPEFCPECPEIQPQAIAAADVYVPNVVFFRLNSATIDRQQQISVYNTAEYLKSNPNATVEIVAYADRQTGTPDYNMKLSERRAKAVADALTSQYNVDSSRISLDWKGDTEQPYAENDWNRVAIFIAD